MAKKAEKRDSENNDTLEMQRNELLSEIGNLRTVFRDIVSRYQTNLEAQMVSCINMLSSSDGEESERALDKKHIIIMLDAIRDLRLKPQKGRMKDMRKIDDVVNLLYEKLVEM
jgi:hypothetical protein